MLAAAWTSVATYAFITLVELVASRLLAGTRFDAPPAVFAAVVTTGAVLALREVDSLGGRTLIARGGRAGARRCVVLVPEAR